MSRPRFIQIGANRYETVTRELEDSGITGRLLTRSQLILLEPGLSPPCERDTVLHEVVHAILFHTGAQAGMGWNQDQEEAVVAAVTPLLLDTVQRNPRLVTYLTERS